MKYAIFQCVNGNFSIVSEWTDEEKAYANFHSVCMNLWNAPDVNEATVEVVDEKFGMYKIEYIKQSNA